MKQKICITINRICYNWINNKGEIEKNEKEKDYPPNQILSGGGYIK